MVNVDNVGSKQMQQIRMSLRGRAAIIMGKNTTIRKAIRGHLEQNPQLEKVLPHIRGNVGFVFTSEELNDIREIIENNKVPCIMYISVEFIDGAGDRYRKRLCVMKEWMFLC